MLRDGVITDAPSVAAYLLLTLRYSDRHSNGTGGS
jgi:hypothetical protein